jgi:demethylmenaquinone methyltransferase/2-methoxy-6-polyprenyl-1,4-benzoquinol methylase
LYILFISYHNPSEIDLNRKNYFNRKAKTWDDDVNHNPEKLEHIMDALELESGDSVLDVASGTGVLIPYIYERIKQEGKIICVDISEKMISQSKKKYPQPKYPNIKFKVKDIMDLQLTPRYNAIICYSCFPHFSNKTNLIRHLYKGLKLSGKLIIAHSESRKKINMHHKKLKHSAISHDMLPALKIIKNIMISAGFDIEKTKDSEEMFFIIGIK